MIDPAIIDSTVAEIRATHRIQLRLARHSF